MDEVPQVIAGRYRVECVIGRGGMGTVYRAFHLGLERPVAIKILKTEYAADPEVADRFVREARTMARLRHPSAATIFDAGTLPDKRPFIVMEYVEGETLSETLAREGRFTPARAVAVAATVCDVLAAAHALGIVHRDLKPSNIMLSGGRGVCVLDFGVAKVLATSADATRTHATTESGVVVGTPRYMSPEQCLGQPVGPQSDLYSLGVLLFEMLAGRPPFIDPWPSAVLVKQATAPPPPLPTLRQDLPRALVLAVHALLAKRAQDRPASAAQARTLLEKSLVRTPATELPVMPLAHTVATLDGGAFPRRLFASIFFIAAMSALLLVWGRSGRGAEQTPAVVAPLAATMAAENAAEPLPSPAARTLTPSRAATPLLRRASLAAEEARGIAARFAAGVVEDVRVLRTPNGPVIIGTRYDEETGANQVFVLERRGEQYRLAARSALDTIFFHSANWTSEILDVDGDGYNEVIYSGTHMDGDAAGGRRLVLYVPRSRRFFILRVEPQGKRPHSLRVQWSPNAMTRAASPFRSALERRARSLFAAL